MDVRVRAILFQYSPKDNKVQPCIFFSWKLLTAERNYGVGNRELLAMKLALEEWRHWLEGTEHHFCPRPTIRTWSASTGLKGSILSRLYSSPDSTSPCPIILGLIMSSQMPFLSSLRGMATTGRQWPFCPQTV